MEQTKKERAENLQEYLQTEREKKTKWLREELEKEDKMLRSTRKMPVAEAREVMKKYYGRRVKWCGDSCGNC